MGLKLKDGNYVLGPTGLPQETDGLEELLQNALLRLSLPGESFPYDRSLGSSLAGLDTSAEHALERAVALANDALLDLPGVRVERAKFWIRGTILFTLSTPLGEGEVTYGTVR